MRGGAAGRTSAAARSATPGARWSRSSSGRRRRARARARPSGWGRGPASSAGVGQQRRIGAHHRADRRVQPRARRRAGARLGRPVRRRSRHRQVHAAARRGRTMPEAAWPVLYVSAEESPHQVKLRADRMGVPSEHIYILPETDIDAAIDQADRLQPGLVIVDSIQTVSVEELPSSTGSVTQVRESAARLMRWAKAQQTPVFIVGHVTKEGDGRRPAGAGAHGRRRALPGGRPPPPLPHPARRQEPLWLDQRGRRLRDGGERAARGQQPLRGVPGGAAAGHGRLGRGGHAGGHAPDPGRGAGADLADRPTASRGAWRPAST